MTNIDQLVGAATQSRKTCSTTRHQARHERLFPIDARQKQQARHQDAASTPRQDVDGQSGEEMRASSPVDVRTTSPDLLRGGAQRAVNTTPRSTCRPQGE